jgi:hypothetical protein
VPLIHKHLETARRGSHAERLTGNTADGPPPDARVNVDHNGDGPMRVRRRNGWSRARAERLFGAVVFAIAFNAFRMGFLFSAIHNGKIAKLLCPATVMLLIVPPAGFAFARGAYRLITWPRRGVQRTPGRSGLVETPPGAFGSPAGDGKPHSLDGLARVEVRKLPEPVATAEAKSDPWSCIRTPRRADAPYAVALADHSEQPIGEMDQLNEEEAVWLAAGAGEFYRVPVEDDGARMVAVTGSR